MLSIESKMNQALVVKETIKAGPSGRIIINH